jgi:hypothetical protein
VSRHAVIVLALLWGCPMQLSGDPLEPPPESSEDQDFEGEHADSLAEGNVEVGIGASGRLGQSPRRTRRVRFESDSVGGTFREGAGDPLVGAAVQGRGAGGDFSMGKLSPRWGRGLVIGALSEPWSRATFAKHGKPAYRVRSGEGAWYRARRDAFRIGVLYGRFSGRTLGGFSTGAGKLGLGALADRSGRGQGSLCIEGEESAGELALDRAGRWRAEAALDRRVGSALFAGMVRGGHAAFRSMAEPKRSGPSQAAAVNLETPVGAIVVNSLASLWRFGPGLTGARASLEMESPVAEHSVMIWGFEEQHGSRRLPAASSSWQRHVFRHGIWGEWQGGTQALRMRVRHEVWGDKRLARHAVRTVSSARVETNVPGGATVRITHTAYQVQRGESLFLPELETDRLVLRSLAGAGERTRLEVGVPAAGGTFHAALNLSTTGSASSRPQWVVDWTRRSRIKRGR